MRNAIGTALYLVAVILGFALMSLLAGCTPQQAATAATVVNDIKTGVAISDAALVSVNQIVQAADPASKVASQIAGATTIANKVNGVTQSISIVIPVTPVAATPAPAATGQ